MFYKVNRKLKGASYNAVKNNRLFKDHTLCMHTESNPSYPTGFLMLTSRICTAFISYVAFLICLTQPNNFTDSVIITCVSLR